MNEIERQIKSEVNSIQDGILKFCKQCNYGDKTLSKPARNLISEVWNAMANGILEEQTALKNPGGGRLPRYALALLSLSHEKLA
jgi:hypothetical protein